MSSNSEARTLSQMVLYMVAIASIEFARGAMFISLLPAYLPERVGIPTAMVGIIVSVQYLADGLLRSPAGWLVDRFGAWVVLAPALSVAAAAAVLLPRIHSFLPLLLVAVLFGAGTSPNWPAAISGSVRASGLKGRAAGMSLVFMAWIGGGGLGPVLVNFLINHGYRLAFRVAAGVALLAPIVAIARLLTLPADQRVQRQDPAAAAAASGSVGQFWRHLWHIRALLPGMFVQTLALGMLVPILVPFAKQDLGLSQPQFGLLMVAGGAVTVALLLPMGRLADHYGFRIFLVVGFALAGISAHFVGRAAPGFAVLPVVLVLGASYATILPAWNGVMAGAVPEQVRATFMGLFMTVEGLGLAIGPALGGALWTLFGHRSPFDAASLVLVAMAAIYTFIPVERLATAGSRWEESA
ncbi:MAG TPA: MFS transporter [Bacillota bacterium]|nr:MFS transporter [Bacillota bacterium]